MTGVVVAGAGPAGLLLGCELRLAGVDVVVLEREPAPRAHSRSFTLNSRALDLLGLRGLAAPLVDRGWAVPHTTPSGLPVALGLAGARTAHPFTLGVAQTEVEALLEARARELGVDLRRGHELLDLDQDASAVRVRTDRGALEAQYLVGCDGGRSAVRKRAGIGFGGTGPDRWWLLGDAVVADLPPGTHEGPGGTVVVIPRPGHVRVITADAEPGLPVTADRFRATVRQALGRDPGVGEVHWLTRYGDTARVADEYARDRVLLAGDAARVHPPVGANGVSVALDDALNLGWKLAAGLRGNPRPLATYQPERRAAGLRVVANARAQLALVDAAPDDPVRDLLTRLVGRPEVAVALAEELTCLDTRYPVVPEGGHSLLGRLLPVDGLLPRCRGALLGRVPEAESVVAGWAGPVDVVERDVEGHPGWAFLVRPDGHVAWAGRDGAGLADAVRHWF